jgi:hypothetical protein
VPGAGDGSKARICRTHESVEAAARLDPAAIGHAAFSDWYSFYGQTDIPRLLQFGFGGTPFLARRLMVTSRPTRPRSGRRFRRCAARRTRPGHMLAPGHVSAWMRPSTPGPV